MAFGRELSVVGRLELGEHFEGTVRCGSLHVASGVNFVGVAVVDGDAWVDGSFEGVIACRTLEAGPASRARGAAFLERLEEHVSSDFSMAVVPGRPEIFNRALPSSHVDVEKMISDVLAPSVLRRPEPAAASRTHQVSERVPSEPTVADEAPDRTPEVRSLHQRLVEKGLAAPDEPAPAAPAPAPAAAAQSGRMALPSLV